MPLQSDDQPKSALNPTVLRLGLVSFFADVSSEMLYPITPIFLTTVLGASAASLGLIEGVAEGTASLVKTFSGIWSDRAARRKPFIGSGYFLAAIAKPMIAAAQAWPLVLFARALDRLGKGIRGAPRDALLADATPEAARGAAFGWHRAMDTLGAVLGPTFALLYLSLGWGTLREIYLWALVPGLAATALVFSVKEEKKPTIRHTKPEWKIAALPPAFRAYLCAWGIFSLTNSSDVFLLLRARQRGAGLRTTILMYCLYNLIYSFLSPYLGGLSDRIGRKKVLTGGLFVFAAVYLGFAFAGLKALWPLFAVYGIYMAATDGVGKAFAVDLGHRENKATAVGVLGTVSGLATIFASIVAGLLWDHAGPAWAFGYGASGAILAGVSILFI